MDSWKSPRKIEEERLAAIEAERQRQFKLFDDLEELLVAGVITIDQLKEIMAKPEDELWTPAK